MRVFNTQLLSGLIFSLLITAGSLVLGQTYSSAPGMPIPDNDPAGISDTITIPPQQTDVITDLNVDLVIDHTWVGDLTVTLTHVATGTVVTLIEAPGAPPTSNSCPGDNINATMDDAAALPVETTCDTPSVPAISGARQPNGLLASFNGETLAGQWVLKVSDNGTGDVGTLMSWTLNFTTVPGIPYNDICDNAYALECGDMTTGTTINATIDNAITPACSTLVEGPGVWYTVEGNGDSITVSLCNPGTTYDTRLNIYTGSCDSLVCVTGDDDACGFAGPSEVTFLSDPCVTYYILVHGFSGASGDFEISVTCNSAPTTLVADAGTDAAFCYDGGANSTTLGGAPTGSGGHYLFPYHYSWSPTIGLSDPTSSNPTTGGVALVPGVYNYTVTVTDTCGLVATDVVTVTVWENPVADAGADQAFCFDLTTTTLNGSATNGTAPYSYQWSPSTNLSNPNIASPVFTAPAAGTYTYTLTVTDANGCTDQDVMTIEVYPEPTVDAGMDTAICEKESVVIGAMPTATGGTPPYTYSWSPNYYISSTTADNPTVDPRMSTTYSVTLTDANGCTDSDTVRIKVFPETPVSFTGLDPIYCGSDPCATLTGSPAGGIFSGPGIVGNDFCPGVAGAGTHMIIYTYTDVNGCVNADTQTTVVTPILVVDAGADQTICNNVSINLGGSPTASGGTGPYTYSWLPTDYLDDPTAANPLFTPTAIPSYSYTVTVTDANGCSTSDVININTLPAPVADAGADVNKCDECPGVTIGGYPTGSDGDGSLNYSYSWSPVTGLDDPTHPNPIASPAVTTTYTVVVTDNFNGCTDEDEVTVTVNPLPSVSIVGLDPGYCTNGGNITLTGSPAGGTFYGEGVSGTSTSTEVFKICYDGGNMAIPDNALPLNVILNGQNIQGENLGTDVWLDSVSITIDHTWVGDLSVTLESPNGTNVVLVDRPGVPASTFGCDGDNISATFTTGTGNSVENVCNSYMPTIHGTFTAHTGDLNNLNDGSNPNGAWTLEITDIISGNTGDFVTATLYFSSEGASSATAILDPTVPTTSPVMVYYAYTDANGCKNIDSQSVELFDPPIVSAGADQTICSNETATLGSSPVAVGNGPFTYSWMPAADLDDATAENPVFTPSAPGSVTFTVTVTDANGCSDMDMVTINVNEAPVADAGADDVICADGSIVLGGSPVANGGTPPYTYTWAPALGLSSTSSANPTFTPVGPATYSFTVTVTDANGCTDDDVVEILVNPLPTVDAGADFDICVDGTGTLGGSPVATGNGPFTYSWAPTTGLDDATAENPVFDPSTDGTFTFTVTVTDANGCVNTDAITVTVNPLPIVDAGADQAICKFEGVTLGGSPTASAAPGGSSAFIYNWSPATYLNTTTLPNPVASDMRNTTTYTITVTDGNGCVSSDDVTITVYPLPVVTFSGFASSYCEDDNTDYVLTGSPSGGTFTSTTPLIALPFGGAQYSQSYTMTPVSIPAEDPAGITLAQTVNVPGTALGTDITLDSVSIQVSHTGVGDLYIAITNPAGTTVELLDHPYPYWYDNIDASWVAGTSNPATNAVFPYPAIQGNVNAVNGDDLANLNDGSNPNGNWNLFIKDDLRSFYSGTITGATLYFSGPSEAFNPSIAGVGTYTIIYTYTDANGCTNADTQTTEVHPIPVVSFTGLDSIYCADADIDTLIGSPAGGVFAGPGVQSQSTGTPSACSYTLDMYDSWGDGWNGGYLEVYVNGTQVPGNNGMQFKAFGSFSSATFLVEDGATIELYYTSGSFESENSFDLLDPNGNVVYSAGPNIPTGKIYTGTSTTSGCGLMYTFSAPLAGPGTHTIYYTYVDGNGCSNVDSQTITVLTPLVVDAGSDASICAYPGETVVLGGSPTASGSEGTYTYTWTPATNLDDPTAANPIFTQPGAGDYSYIVNVIDGQGCEASDAVNIHVDTVPVVSFTGLDTAYCINDLPDTLVGTPKNGTFSGPGVVTIIPGGGGSGGGPTCTPAGPLTTTFSSNNGQNGNMFDIVAINNVQIQSFDINIDNGTYTIEIYTKTGTWQGFETNASAWTLISTSTVTSAGFNNPTPLNLSLAVPINAGDRQAFYITVTNATAMNYTNGTSLGSVYAQDANIQFLQGCGKSYPFGSTFQPRIWNGNIYYDVCTPSAPGGNVTAPPLLVTQCTDPYSDSQQKSIISGGTWSYTFTGVPTPTADGSLDMTALGDLDFSSEYINIYDENGNYLGLIGQQSPQCGTITQSINLPLADLQNWAADGVISFTAQATSSVGVFCGGDYLELNLNYCKGAVITQDFVCNTIQVDDSGLPVPIPPSGTGGFGSAPTVRNLSVTGVGGTIGQTIGLNTQLDQVILKIDHTWNSDLDVYLTAPNGAQIELWTDVGGSSDGFDVVITDNAPNSIATAGTGFPITGTYRAEGGLLNSVLAGSPANGTWKLEIFDDAGGDAGTLNDFSLVFQTCVPSEQITLFWPDSAGVGTHWITYTFTDANGCTGVDSQQVTVYPLADLNVEQDTTVCRGEPVTLTATASGTPGPYEYTWLPADGLDTTMGAVVVATPDSTTTYTVFVSDGRGCSTLDSVQVVIWQPPVVKLKNVNGSDTVCYNELVCLWADVEGVGEDAPVPELIYYKFDQSGQSSVDNFASSPVGNNPAPILGSLKQTGTGQFGSALQGVGGSSASNYVNTGWNTDLGDGSWTISFWTHKVPWNVAGNLTSPWHVFGDPSANDFRCEVGSFNAGSPGSMVLRGPFPDVEVANVSYGPSVVTYVHDSASGEVRGYLDGQRVTTVTYNLVPLQLNGNGPFKVGGYGNLNGLSNGMLIDEFRVYNRALTDQQVLATAFIQLQDSTGLTYIWSNTSSGNDTVCFNATQNEMITVDVIDENGCVGSDTFNLVVNPEVVVFAGDDRVLCKGESTVLGGTPTASGGVGTLSYEWQPFDRLSDPMSANPTADPLINTTYTVIVTDEAGCSYTDEVTITVNDVPMADAGGDVEICDGESVVIGGTPAASGGVGPYTYSWLPVTGLSDPTAANPTASPSVTTAYTLTVTDANGCTDDSLMRVIVRPLPDVTIDPAGPVCVNDAPITLTAASMGGMWSGNGITDAAAGTFDPAVAGAGTHTVMYTNTTEFGCTDSATMDIVVVPLPQPVIAGPNAYCLNQGIVTLSASPAGGMWTGAGIVDANTGDFDPVAAGLGTHMVVYAYTDATGCTGYDTAMVSVSEAPEVSIRPAGPFCQSDDPVNLSGSPMGGTWSGTGITDANAGTFDPSVAGVGSHVITYTYVDPIGCTVSVDITIVVDGIANLTITPAGPFCQEANTSLMSASVGGGYWSGPGIINPLNGEFSPAVAGPGNHTITYTVTGADGCVTITSGQVTVNPSPNTDIVQVGPFCADEPAINLQAATPGGTWSGNGIVNGTAGTFDPSVAGAGTHIINYEVTDANGCFNTGTTTIKVNELPVVSGSVTDVTCSGYSNGKIDIDVEGGAPPYRYDWSNGEVSQDIDEITAGTYSFTVTDAKGCANTATFTVGVQSGVISASAVVTNATTPVYNNGSIDVTITGGVAPYLYTWSNGAESEDVSGLRPDTYTLVVTDALGCSETFTFTVGADFGLGISEDDLSSRVSLFPNPTSDVININIELAQKQADLNMTVFDMLGRKVYEVHGAVDKSYQHTIQVKDWASGQYMVRFDIDGTLVTKKFVITK